MNITCENSHEPYVYSLRNIFNHVCVQTIHFSRIVIVNPDYFKSYQCFDFTTVFFLKQQPITNCCDVKYKTLNTQPCYVIKNLEV